MPQTPNRKSPAPAAKAPLRILLADNHKLLREALKMVVEQQDDMTCIGEAQNGLEALQLVEELHPDIVVMDIGMPDMGGIQATLLIREKFPETRIVGLSVFHDRHIVLQMLNAGASGYVAKSASRDEFLRGIRAAGEGNRYLSPEASQSLVNGVCNGNPARLGNGYRLGRRESQVLQLLADGLTSPAIGQRLHIATSTVEVHRRNIMCKLDLHNIAELTKYAIRQGLTEIGPPLGHGTV